LYNDFNRPHIHTHIADIAQHHFQNIPNGFWLQVH